MEDNEGEDEGDNNNEEEEEEEEEEGDREDDNDGNYSDDDDEDNYSDDDDEGNGDDEEGSFKIYKIGSEKDNLISIDNFGDQILILEDQGSLLSLSTSDFEELEGNCIYFGSDNGNDKLDPLDTLKPNIARDLDAFYLIDGAIEPSFPNLNMPIQLFTPILL
ncbi:serine/threonine-protein phosphatase 4 regulatory subunit 2-like [Rosa chinensis]|uniref:serine/threonine-protein phosphatase 4 regulatory subunit 2-like n=1 Tax=Rosa chinensis TaxID=74649 RepID=UPI000D088AD8|nr:serine/threonine-protein phosphatase 4 regulatory subunit 2-like [Rosa chinensis]